MAGKYDYEMTKVCYEDIDRALEYISVNLANPDAAADLWESIEGKISDVRVFPYSYPDCHLYFVPDSAYRHVIIGNYMLVFRVNEEKHTVEFLRFLYSRMDFTRQKL